MWTIRPADPSDAEAACTVLRASIVQLCQDDHGGDAATLDAWLANKRPEIVREWITSNPGGVLVAEASERLGGVGAVLHDGRIVVNYVAPWARFQGVSRALMAAMEARAAALGHAQCRLTSTVTARRFYLALGYTPDGPPIASFGGKPAHPMRRALPVTPA